MAKTNDKFIALNGCPVKCSSLTLDKIGIKEYKEFILTSDFNIEKNKNYSDETNIDKVREAVKIIIESLSKG